MKGWRPVDELVEHDAEREDVGLLRDGLASRLLGRHIADRAEQQARFGRRPPAGRRCVADWAAARARPKSSSLT